MVKFLKQQTIKDKKEVVCKLEEMPKDNACCSLFSWFNFLKWIVKLVFDFLISLELGYFFISKLG